MVARFPPIPPSAQKPYQTEIHAIMDETRESLGTNQVFAGKDDEGALVGPFAVFIRYPPSFAKAWVEYGNKVASNPQLTLQERQLAVLAVCSVYKASFMTYAHIRISKECGLSADQVYDARTGKLPEGLSKEETAAYEFSRATAAAREVIPEELFNRSMKILGEEKIIALINAVTLWSATSLLMHACDVPIPDGGKIEK